MFPVLVVVPREIHSRITARTVQERETRVVKSNTRKSKNQRRLRHKSFYVCQFKSSVSWQNAG